MRTVLVAAAACVALAFPTAAQERVRFDRRAHLEGYEEVVFSDFADLYDLEPFAETEGRRVGPERLAELRRAWAEERARVEALLEAERSDPKRWALFLLERWIAGDSFLSQVDWTRIDDADGFVVYVQRPRKDEPGHAERVARETAERLAPLREHFRAAYAEPAGLTRREGFGAEVVFVLATVGDMQTFVRLSGASPHYRVFSAYSPKLRAAILVEYPLEKRIGPDDRLRAARHAYAHLLLHAHEGDLERPLQEDWLREGLASHLDRLDPSPDGGLVVPADSPVESLRKLVAAMQSPETARTHVLTVDELYARPTYQHVYSVARIEAKREGRDEHALDFEGMHLCYWRQALCLVDYLHRDGRRPGFLQLLADELEGRGGPASFARAFPAKGADAFDRAFLEHLVREHRRLLPDVPVADGAIEAVLRKDQPPPVASASGGGTPSAAADPVAEPEAEPAAEPARPFEPADLAPRDLGPEETLALSLDLARRGRSEDAEARLAEALEGALEPDAAARLERAREQIAAWNRLCAAWLADLAARGGRFRFEHDRRSVRPKVVRFEDGVLHVDENRSDLTQLALEELDPLAVAKQMGSDAGEMPDGWARALPYALAGERRALSLLDGGGAAEAALAADLEDDLPELLARGVALGELDALSRLPLPRDPTSCEDVLARLADLVRDHGEVPEVAARRAEIRAYASRALEVVFDLEGVPQLVRGAWESLPGERVRIAYEFDDEAELGDFTRDDDYLAFRRKGLPELKRSRTDVRVEGGALRSIGEPALRHRLGFAPPLTVRYDLDIGENPEGGDAEVWLVLVGICARGESTFAGAYNFDELETCVDRHYESAVHEPRMSIFLDTTYALELSHDGDTMRLTVEGRPRQELPASDLEGGGLFLFVHSDHEVRIERLEIEGALDEESVEAARAEWIEDQLGRRGF